MVAGIIAAAVGDELVIAHPGGAADATVSKVILGAPAMYLAGHAAFKRAVFGVLSLPRIAAIVLLGVALLAGRQAPPLLLLILATVVVAAVAASDNLMLRAEARAGAATEPAPAAPATHPPNPAP